MWPIRRIRRFLFEDIWRVDLAARSRVTRLVVHLLRTVILAVRGLSRHRSSVWAASLTYVSLMSVIPFVALVVGLGARLGVPGKAVESLTGQMPESQLSFLRSAAEAFEKADLKAIGVVAFLVLLWAMVKALTGVEKALNEIWGAERGRSFLLRLSNYVSVAVLGPLLILSGMALTAAIMSSTFMAQVSAIPVAGKTAHFLLSAGPYLTAWLGLALLYWLLPNARVRFFSGAAGAVVAGVLWQLVQRLYFGVQREVVGLGVAYGAFAAIPMFLAWVYVSWLIVLLGAEIGYGLQHAGSFAFGRGFVDPSPAAREKAGLRVALLLARRFLDGKGGLDSDRVAETLRYPERFTKGLLDVLAKGGVLSRLEDGGFQVARPPDAIQASEVAGIIRREGVDLPAGAAVPGWPGDRIEDLEGRALSAFDIPLTELLADAPASSAPGGGARPGPLTPVSP